MVKIKSIDELKQIKKTNFGFIIVSAESIQTIHTPNCTIVSEKEYNQNSDGSIIYHWFSSHSLAEKELGDITMCKICNP